MYRLLPVISIAALAACEPEPTEVEISGETMGTTYSIIALDADGEMTNLAAQSAVETTLAAVNAAMSNWDPNSEISTFNAAETTDPVEISPEMATVMSAAMEVHEASLGQFDVTLGPLIELWGFGARNSESPIPEDAAIEAALNVVGQSKVLTLTDTTMAKAYPDTSVFLAAIAKGYGVDRIAQTLDELGAESYLVEIGGDLVTKGLNPQGEPWQIGIERPDAATRTVEEVVGVSGLGMATSGDYRNYFEEDGVRYSHIIDAVEGRPISHLTASVTVLTEDAMMADAWATALLALGSERGLPISEEQGLAVLFIDRDPAAGEGGFVTQASSAFEALQTAE